MEFENSTSQMEIELNSSAVSSSTSSQSISKIKIVQIKRSKSLENLSSAKGKEDNIKNQQLISSSRNMDFLDLNQHLQKLNLVHD
jgi:adenine specific DNA methylase Mod